MTPWIAFEAQMPTPPHGRILVTNNLSAKDAHGFASHAWMVGSVYRHRKQEMSCTRPGYVEAYEGEITAFTEDATRLRNLTHWRPALPEEWGQTEDPVLYYIQKTSALSGAGAVWLKGGFAGQTCDLREAGKYPEEYALKFVSGAGKGKHDAYRCAELDPLCTAHVDLSALRRINP